MCPFTRCDLVFMADFFDFLLRHWVLSGAFTVVLFLFIINEIKQQGSSRTKLSTQQAVELINHENAVVIDVRSNELYNLDHILGAKNYPQQELAARMNKLAKFKSKPLIVVCDQGAQSPKIVNQLQNEGFESVFYLAGGIAAWKSENLPLTK